MNQLSRHEQGHERERELIQTSQAARHSESATKKKILKKKDSTRYSSREGMRDNSTHKLKKKKKWGNASGAEVPREDNEDKSTNVKGEKRTQSVKK